MKPGNQVSHLFKRHYPIGIELLAAYDEANTLSATIDVSELASGSYILELNFEDRVLYRRFIVSKVEQSLPQSNSLLKS